MKRETKYIYSECFRILETEIGENMKFENSPSYHQITYLCIVYFVAPGNPVITGPTFIVEGNSVALTCTSSGGNPVPTVYWYRNGQLVDDTQTTTNGVTSNTYNFVADKTHNLAVFECQVDNNVLQNKLSTTWFFQVYSMYYFLQL